MKTPEEIKCGMECIRTNAERICVKPEKGQCPRCEQLVGEALVRIRQLEQRIAQAEKERDAAVYDLSTSSCCVDCKHYKLSEKTEPCKTCLKNNRKELWQWRGICEENSKEENNG